MTLGYHRPGDYFYHVLMPSPVYALGGVKDHDISSPDEFAALAVGVHEHFHLMQEMLQGYCLWRQSTLDSLAVSVAEAVRRLPAGDTVVYPLWDKPVPSPSSIAVDWDNPLSLAKHDALELERCDQLFSYPELTQNLLEAEVEAGPQLAAFLADDAYQLTTRDMIECHAALLTEFYLQSRLTTEPERFKGANVESLTDLFQVERMPETYGRPLRVLVHIFEKFGIRFQMPPSAFEVYSRIKHGSYYLFLAFLLDYALHIPPDPFALYNRVADGATLQDTYPPMRFINLLLHSAIELKTDAHRRNQALSSEAGLYDQASTLLTDCINEMHRRFRMKTRSVLGGLLPHTTGEPPDTFFTFVETTERWRDTLASNRTRILFPPVWRMYDKAIEFRKQQADSWFKPNLLEFDTTVGLPILVDTGQGLHFEPYLTADNAPDEETLKRLAQKGMETYYRVMHLGEEWQAVPDPGLPSTVAPFPYIESVMARSAFHRLALTILLGHEMRCPLTESVGRALPCKKKAAVCRRIPSLGSLLSEGCWLRDTLTQLFIEPERLDQRR
jgi:hypothetical protein